MKCKLENLASDKCVDEAIAMYKLYLVLAEVPGTLVSVAKTTRGGFPSFAVTVMRADGSTVTGYVDRADGVIHDWTQTAAPAPAYNDDDEEGEEGDESESESEHEGSDHDGDDD